MARDSSNYTLIVVAVTLGMLAVPLPAMASHNSVGPLHAHVIQPSELDGPDEGLDPDPDIGPNSPYNLEFHDTLVEDGLKARPAPADQSGLRYTDCKGPDDTNSYDPTNPDHCYVGYFDHILEYSFPTAPALVTECPCDLLYPVNPAPSDDYCWGRDGGNQAEQLVTSVNRRTDSQCNDSQDNSFLPGSYMIDVTLLETGTSTAGQAVGTDPGSGTLSLPFIVAPFVLLLGEPHPDNTNPSPFEAGSGPFGPNPLDGGSPLWDLTGACDGRTDQCKLLTPTDVKLYDHREAPEQARVCAYLPQYSFAVATDTDGSIDRDQGACGNTGNVMDEFFGELGYGGFGTGLGVDTWQTNIPGYSWGVLMDPRFTTSDQLAPVAGDYQDDEADFRPGFINYYAVNPKTPSKEGDLRCMVPNIDASGDGGGVVDSDQDPGVYGTYQADAIDVDIYPHPVHQPARDVRDATHDDVRDVLRPVETLADSVDVGEAADQVNDAVPVDTGPVTQAADRVGPFESDEPGELTLTDEFDAEISAGLACDAAGQLRYRDSAVPLDGGMLFEANVLNNGNLKDPTVLDEMGLPAPEEDTKEGYWQPDVYTFSGRSTAIVDFNQNGEIDACPGANLEPDEDLCPWETLWDAYNGNNCQNRKAKNCNDVLRDNGYDVDGDGVGLYFVLKVTGPVAVTTEPGSEETSKIQEQTTILGDSDLTGTNCIVGTSTGFHEKLANHVSGASTFQEAVDALCDNDNGENLGIPDAFDDQSGVSRGTFSSDISWAKLLPTAKAVRDNVGDLGDEDSLTVTGVWSTQNTGGNLLDTDGENNINLPADGSVYTFSDTITFATGTQ